jgi:hypothetical protein
VRGSGSLCLTLKVLVNYRNYHAGTHAGGWRMSADPVEHEARIGAFEGAAPFYLLSGTTRAEAVHDWYRDFDLPRERYRGLDDREDHLHAAIFRAELEPANP